MHCTFCAPEVYYVWISHPRQIPISLGALLFCMRTHRESNVNGVAVVFSNVNYATGVKHSCISTFCICVDSFSNSYAYAHVMHSCINFAACGVCHEHMKRQLWWIPSTVWGSQTNNTSQVRWDAHRKAQTRSGRHSLTAMLCSNKWWIWDMQHFDKCAQLPENPIYCVRTTFRKSEHTFAE